MATFDSTFIVQTIIYGLPIAFIIILIAAFLMWRKSKLAKSSSASGGNMAFIIDPTVSALVDTKPFFIHRDMDLTKNIMATYALFPDEEKHVKDPLSILRNAINSLMGKSTMEDEEKKGRVFSEGMAFHKIGGGWVTAYSIRTNTQIPIWSEKGITPQIELVERNVEKRMSILKAVQQASQQYESASSYDNLAAGMRLNAFSIIFATAILAIVLISIPGSVSSAVTSAIHQTVSQIGSTIGSAGGSVP